MLWLITHLDEKLERPAELCTSGEWQMPPGDCEPCGNVSLSLVTPITPVTGYGRFFTTVMGTKAAFEVSLISPAFTDNECSWVKSAAEASDTAVCCFLAPRVLVSARSSNWSRTWASLVPAVLWETAPANSWRRARARRIARTGNRAVVPSTAGRRLEGWETAPVVPPAGTSEKKVARFTGRTMGLSSRPLRRSATNVELAPHEDGVTATTPRGFSVAGYS